MNPIECLGNDVRNLLRLLDMLDRQAAAIARGLPPDLELLRAVADFCRDFPDPFHRACVCETHRVLAGGGVAALDDQPAPDTLIEAFHADAARLAQQVDTLGSGRAQAARRRVFDLRAVSVRGRRLARWETHFLIPLAQRSLSDRQLRRIARTVAAC